MEYWNTQPYTLQAFRTNSHLDKGSRDANNSYSTAAQQQQLQQQPKKRPTPSAVLLELEKKRKLTDIRDAKITAEPPQGLTWQDIKAINNVFYSGKNIYFAEVRWTRPDMVSYIPTRIIRKNNPLKVSGVLGDDMSGFLTDLFVFVCL